MQEEELKTKIPLNVSSEESIDQLINRFNNEIGIRYGLEKPFLTKQQLLEQLYEDHNKNRKARIQELGN